MKKALSIAMLLLFVFQAPAQNVFPALSASFESFMKDSQLAVASVSFYVIDRNTGEVVLDHNGRLGMAPASTQKIITAAAAYSLLGQEFKYKTDVTLQGRQKGSEFTGTLSLDGSFDPTLGSERYFQTRSSVVYQQIITAFKSSGIKKFKGSVIISPEPDEAIPGGWIWQDIGNYYGAGARKFSWRENQFDVLLKSGPNEGDSVKVAGYVPDFNFNLRSLLTTGKPGSGDQAYIYFPQGEVQGVIRGTIPPNESGFKISGSVTNPTALFADGLQKEVSASGISFQNALAVPGDKKVLTTVLSPSFDSIVYWFLRKSINLYGEGLIKTMAFRSGRLGSTEEGVRTVKEFIKRQGMDPRGFAMVDGSGLSPLNRVSAHAQVSVLKYATTQSWFPAYYNAFPEYNGMKMKSGTINGAKGFCGYQKSASGKEYIYSFLVNNYNGPAGSLVKKMYVVLDNLK